MRRGRGDRDAGQVVHDDLVGALVELHALGVVDLLGGLLHRLEDLLVLEAPLLVVLGEPGTDEVVGVVEVTGPAEQVQLAAARLGGVDVVRGPLGGLRGDGDADLLQVGLHQLEEVTRGRHVRTADLGRVAELDLQLLLAGLLQQALGLRRVVVVLLDLVGVALDGVRDELRGRDAALGELGLDQVVLVDRVSDGGADVLVLERLVLLLGEAQVEDVEDITGGDLEAGLLQGLHVGGRHEVVAVDVTGLEGRTAAFLGVDGAEDEVLDPGLLAPVVVEALELDFLVALVPLRDLVRAGTGDRAGLLAVLGVGDGVALGGRLLLLVRLQRLRRVDREGLEREAAGKVGGGLVHLDDGGVLVLRRAGLVVRLGGVLVLVLGEAAHDGLPVVRHGGTLVRARPVEPVVVVGADRLGVERLTVVELDALAQVEGPDGALVVRVPLLGEAADELRAAGLVLQQRLEGLAGDAEGLTVGRQRRVEGTGVAGAAEHEGVLGAVLALPFRGVSLTGAPGDDQRGRSRDRDRPSDSGLENAHGPTPDQHSYRGLDRLNTTHVSHRGE